MLAELCGTLIVAFILLMLGLIFTYPMLRWLNQQRKRITRGLKYQSGRLIFHPSWWLVHISYINGLHEQIHQLEATIRFREDNEIKKERKGKFVQYKIDFDTPKSYNGQYYPFQTSDGAVWGIKTSDYKKYEEGQNAILRNGKVVWVNEDYKLQKHERWADYGDLFVMLEDSKQLPLFQEN